MDYIYPLEVGQLSREDHRETRKNTCRILQVVSSQFDFVHVVTKMLSSVKDCRELMERCVVGKLDQVKEHSLGENSPGTADESAAVTEGGNVYKCHASLCRV